WGRVAGGLGGLGFAVRAVNPVAPVAAGGGGGALGVVPAKRGHPGFPPDWKAAGGLAHDPAMGNIDGAGGDAEPQRAAFLAVAESLERYSSCAWRPDRVIWATARELGDEAVDLDAWPRCSATELADPACTLLPPDPDGPMRWV